VRFVPLGVRGSTPAPGQEFIRWGGHTSCVAVYADGEAAPALMLDAGTGLRNLGGLLDGAPFHGSIVLSHLHWDHVQGLPFSRAVDHPDARVHLHVPVDDERADPRAVLAAGFSPPHFPIGPEGLLGDWSFCPLLPGPVAHPGAAVRAARIPHKGGSTFGIRVEMDGAALVYLPDHALGDGAPGRLRESAAELAAGADVLLHDGQFTAGEEAVSVDYGHATLAQAMAFADACEVGRLVLTHHAPGRTDDALDALEAATTRTPAGRPVAFARQDVAVEMIVG
jgi:phosphoribosyl 1,2-cyclic phosphodiesterase